jgi:hypothetical protein
LLWFNLIFHLKSKSKRVNPIANTTEIAHGNYGEVRAKDNFAYGEWSKYANLKCVYSIKCNVTNKQYIGSTTDLQMCLSKHFSHLHAGNHPNTNLQKDYTKYGFDNFTIEVLKTCDNILEEERNFQISIGIDNLYNMKISNYYMDDKLRQKYANSDKSSHKTKEYREKMSNLKSNYIAQFDLAGNPIAIWDSVNEIHEKLGYTCSVIRCGCNGSKKHPYGYYWRYCDSQGNILDNGYGNKKE